MPLSLMNADPTRVDSTLAMPRPHPTRRHTQFDNLLEHLSDAICLVDIAEGVVYQNARFRKLLDEDSQVYRLLDEVRRSAGALLSLATRDESSADAVTPARAATEGAWQEIRTAHRCYRLRGVLLQAATFTATPVVAVVIVPVATGRVSTVHLRERYRLSPREAEVAWLLADGCSTRELSATLRISPHTARHHTENVLRKLGVKRRAEVGRRLRGD